MTNRTLPSSVGTDRLRKATIASNALAGAEDFLMLRSVFVLCAEKITTQCSSGVLDVKAAAVTDQEQLREVISGLVELFDQHYEAANNPLLSLSQRQKSLDCLTEMSRWVEIFQYAPDEESGLFRLALVADRQSDWKQDVLKRLALKAEDGDGDSLKLLGAIKIMEKRLENGCVATARGIYYSLQNILKALDAEESLKGFLSGVSLVALEEALIHPQQGADNARILAGHVHDTLLNADVGEKSQIRFNGAKFTPMANNMVKPVFAQQPKALIG
ncbi:MAG: hypothetical protein ACOYK8_09280 [Alphaproteobacteria bacterium]